MNKTVRVRCCGQLHRITWRRGHLTLHNHRTTDLRLLEKLRISTRCGAILAAASEETHPVSPIIPRPLRRSLRLYWHRKALGQIQQIAHHTSAIRISHGPNPLEARGRNGWFEPYEILVGCNCYIRRSTQEVYVAIKSDHPYQNVPPIYIRGPRGELLRLYRQIVKAIETLPPHKLTTTL